MYGWASKTSHYLGLATAQPRRARLIVFVHSLTSVVTLDFGLYEDLSHSCRLSSVLLFPFLWSALLRLCRFLFISFINTCLWEMRAPCVLELHDLRTSPETGLWPVCYV